MDKKKRNDFLGKKTERNSQISQSSEKDKEKDKEDNKTNTNTNTNIINNM